MAQNELNQLDWQAFRDGNYEMVEVSRDYARGLIDLLGGDARDDDEDLIEVLDQEQGNLTMRDRKVGYVVIKITEG